MSMTSSLAIIQLHTQDREDGGLRVESPDVPGLYLSHRDRDAVLRDLVPAIKHLLKSHYGVEVELSPVQPSVRAMLEVDDERASDVDPLVAAIETNQLVVARAER